MIAHPTEVLPPYEVAAVAAGPAVYLLAHVLFRRRVTGATDRGKLLGTLACAVAGLVGLFVPALALAGTLIAVLVAVIGADHLAALRCGVEGEVPSSERLGAGSTGR